MTTLKRYSEHVLQKTQTRRTVNAFNESFQVESIGTGWRTLLVTSGKRQELSRYSSRRSAFEGLGSDIVKHFQQGATILPIFENESPSWYGKVADRFAASEAALEFGIFNEIIVHEHGVAISFTDLKYSEKLDDLGLDQTMETLVLIDLIFTEIPEEDSQLIDLGLESFPAKYDLEITVELESTHASVSSFHSQDFKSWSFDFEEIKENAPMAEDPADAVETILSSIISPWFQSSTARSLEKLERLASSR